MYAGLGYQHIQFWDKGGNGAFLFCDIPVKDKITFNYTFGLGAADRSGYYGHVPISAVGATAVLQYGFPGIAGFFIALIPEAVSFRIQTTNRVNMNLVVSPLSLYFWNSPTEKSTPLVPQLGLSFYVKTNKGTPFLRLDGSAGYQLSTRTAGVQFGAAFCVKI